MKRKLSDGMAYFLYIEMEMSCLDSNPPFGFFHLYSLGRISYILSVGYEDEEKECRENNVKVHRYYLSYRLGIIKLMIFLFKLKNYKTC